MLIYNVLYYVYKRSLISLPFSFLFAILEPNCSARFGKLAAFTSPNLKAANLNNNFSPKLIGYGSFGQQLEYNINKK